ANDFLDLPAVARAVELSHSFGRSGVLGCARITLDGFGLTLLRFGKSGHISAGMAASHIDERLMRTALAEARKGLGRTSPNPAVGAVLVAKNKIVSRGHHRRAGSAHAEIECLEHVPRKVVRESTLYVTLEPCSTVGRTGRCTDTIIKSDLQNIVIGAV